MKKEDIVSLAQILTGMKEAAEKLDKAQKGNDKESVARYKKELLDLHEEVNRLI